ncbi:MAG: small ribosomal subunit Rsm22 family protein [Nitrospiria bacterium]
MHPYFQFPQPLIQIIEYLCLKESGQKNREDFVYKFSPEISKLSDIFNQRTLSNTLGSTLQSSYYPLAYIAYFLPSNFFKVPYLFLDLFQATGAAHFSSWKGGNQNSLTVSVLDLGAGPGTNVLSFLDFCGRFPLPFFENQKIDYLAVDQDGRQLSYSTVLFSRYHEISEPSLIRRGISFEYRVSQKKINVKSIDFKEEFDFIFIGNLLNEMKQNGHSPEALAAWIKSMVARLTPRGTIFIIEPALRKTSRDLLEIRNLIAAEGAASVIAPCLHQGPCPIMTPEGSIKDWCHQEKEWEAPEWIHQIDRQIGNRKDALKYSYLILTSPEWKPNHPPLLWRTVSEVLSTKGKNELFLCNASGRLRFYLLNKEENSANRSFSKIKRGELVEIKGKKPLTGTRVLPDWEIRIR